MKRYYVFIFALIVSILLAACNGANNNQIPDSATTQENSTSEQRQSSDAESDVGEAMVDSFIEKYNAVAENPITNPVEVDVTDKESGHYRTEFRLGAFSNSYAKTGKIGDITIDVVNCGWNNDELRIYADGIAPEQAVEIVKYASPVMDPSVSKEDLQGVLDYLSGVTDYHDGYFGNLCVTFNKVHGQLMLRTD